MRGATSVLLRSRQARPKFQSTHPMRGATQSPSGRRRVRLISIHAPHAGCDYRSSGARAARGRFQSTHPMRGATLQRVYAKQRKRDFNPRTPCGVRRYSAVLSGRTGGFQSTHPMRGATLDDIVVALELAISIHAPHAGCDASLQERIFSPVIFQSTHPMRGATTFQSRTSLLLLFQSTHPMRGAILNAREGTVPLLHFNPRTPCGVRLTAAGKHRVQNGISIHAPHAGCDTRPALMILSFSRFQSTHPMRGATWHTASARSYPYRFQSTHPMRGATALPRSRISHR